MKEASPTNGDTERMARVHAQYETLHQGWTQAAIAAEAEMSTRDTVETPCRLAPAIRRRVAVRKPA